MELKLPQRDSYNELLSAFKDRGTTIVLFGSGGIGRSYLDELKTNQFPVHYFCDNNPQKVGNTIEDLPVISYDRLKQMIDESKDIAVIPAIPVPQEIAEQMSGDGLSSYVHALDLRNWGGVNSTYGFYTENLPLIKDAYALLADELSKKTLETMLNYRIDRSMEIDICTSPLYFRDDIFHAKSKEVFVDAGAYNGDTILEFMKWRPNMEKAFAFEPNTPAFNQLETHFSSDARVKAFNAGVYSTTSKIGFDSIDTRGSKINVNSDGFINVFALDDVLKDEYVSFIKMDIEGVEKEALEGAREIIRRHRPSLAICAYHLKEDLFKIPLIIHEMLPEYKIYLRQHTQSCEETVCYAATE